MALRNGFLPGGEDGSAITALMYGRRRCSARATYRGRKRRRRFVEALLLTEVRNRYIYTVRRPGILIGGEANIAESTALLGQEAHGRNMYKDPMHGARLAGGAKIAAASANVGLRPRFRLMEIRCMKIRCGYFPHRHRGLTRRYAVPIQKRCYFPDKLNVAGNLNYRR